LLIDNSHLKWIVWTALMFAVAVVLYAMYATVSPHGARGGSWQGMAFGVAGSALMLYAGLLSIRKKVPRWQRLGTAQTWLRGHIWMGLLSVPLILFHAGFRFGGLLETALLIVLALIVLSGIVGLALQTYLPRLMKIAVPSEAIYEAIPAGCAALRKTADEAVIAVCSSLIQSASPKLVTVKPTTGDDESTGALREFYVDVIRPFLAPETMRLQDMATARARSLASQVEAAALFEHLRVRLPAEFYPALECLSDVCDERRQLLRQWRMYHYLHGWTFVHIPLSVLLLVLGILHAATAVYF
jgi:hypothetical protein